MNEEALRAEMLTAVMRELSKLGEEERRLVGMSLLQSTLVIGQESFSAIFESGEVFLFAIGDDAKLAKEAIKSERKTITGVYENGGKRRLN